MHAETAIADGGGSADAALGRFTGVTPDRKLQGKIVAPIELKGAKIDLDKPGSKKGESPVDQGWRYANYTPDCQWVIVSNYRELRLYQTGKTPAYYEQFFLEDLLDFEAFKRFYFLLSRLNFLPPEKSPDSPSRIDRLMSESSDAEEEVTKELYRQYKQVRLELTTHFQRTATEESTPSLIEKAQKTLDRILFIAFCEDRGLLPRRTIRNAYDHQDPYNPRPIWENYKAVFRWVDVGNEDPPISGYNGGLFKHDPLLDEELTVTDRICGELMQLTRYDFATEVSVDILGRIFEQSVTDLEELRAVARGDTYDQKRGKRKQQGVFYTPAFITQYIVGVTVGGYLHRKWEEIREREADEREGWVAYREVLSNLRILDPACGSGAFLIAAYDYLLGEYKKVSDALGEETEEISEQILRHNLFGVDISPESVEITKLSLWLQTAKQGKPLTDLTENIKLGNSLIRDPEVDRVAFDWEREFADILSTGGFDVVIGNPPYVRQELLSPFKAYLEQVYHAFDGVADLYVYFYEQGVRLLKEGGRLSYIVTNKWLRAGYGEGLREFFAAHTVFEQIIDFGHAPIFEDADTFPCIVVLRKERREEETVWVCSVSREELPSLNLAQYVQQQGYEVPWSRFSGDAWSLESPAVDQLMEKIRGIGVPLREFAGVKPCYGIKTGCNDAFLIDEETKNQLIVADGKSAEIIKPYLRGQDIKRWCPDWQNLWMIFTRRGINIDAYPAIKDYLSQYRKRLEPRPKDWNNKRDGKWEGRKPGRYQWYEIQDSVDYYELFEQPKIIYQVIQTLPQYAFDTTGIYGNDKTFILPSADLYLLGCLNSPLIWWCSHRIFTKMLSGSISPMGYLFETLPIAPPTDHLRKEIEPLVSRLIELTGINQQSYQDVLDWLKYEQDIEKAGRKLASFPSLNIDDFIKEVKKRKPKKSGGFSVHDIRKTKEVFNEFAPQIQARNAEIAALERRLADLVNQAYQLTPEEIELMWKTAPPRMPIHYSL
ncbi:Eco57I restriction-modification methylase domain-containing protein [Spirulina sp. CS-785/01]|nr:N-6 DNA methylase [Spirulina sp. CS-785/01]MDB9311958.1 Eco57I restriction-modification methylase domain-containing protein [Spirulina sp. CS-785/01]